MTSLCPDVLELIFKKLPIETRLALRVQPNRVIPSEEVAKTVARMARIAAHPNQLCWVLARVKGHENPVKVMSYRFMEMDLDTGICTQFHKYITPCRTMTLQVSDPLFSPFLYWNDTIARLQPLYQWEIEHLEECEKLGEVC